MGESQRRATLDGRRSTLDGRRSALSGRRSALGKGIKGRVPTPQDIRPHVTLHDARPSEEAIKYQRQIYARPYVLTPLHPYVLTA